MIFYHLFINLFSAYVEDEEEYDIMAIINGYVGDKTIAKPSNLTQANVFKEIHMHQMRGSKYFIIVDEETNHNSTIGHIT